MATLTNLLLPASASGHLRPFDLRRDLGAVADLVEQCFAETLDPDGERYLRQMRTAAQNPGFTHWASMAAEWASVPLSGYVWEEDGRLVGNISLIPFNMQGRRYYLIANVGVHPDYRRQGIARNLTIQALEHARRRGAPSAWLHVRAENDAAVNLYQSLGFYERARRTTWHSSGGIPVDPMPPGLTFLPRRSQYWSQQLAWLRQVYSPEVTWHLPLNFRTLRPGLLGSFYRLITGTYLYQWAVKQGGRLLGILSWQSNRSYADALWLAVDPEREELAARALLLHVRRHLSQRRPLSLDYPAGRATEAIQAAGFYPHQTLIWMSMPFTENR